MISAIILVNNQTVIKITNNSVNHFRVKHINISYHYVRNKIKEKTIKLKYIFIN